MQNQLTKRKIALEIYKLLDKRLSQFDISMVVNHVFEIMTQSLLNGEGIEIRGLGSFDVKKTKSRIGRNPKKPGIDLIIPEMNKIKFRTSKVLSKLLNSSEL